MKASEQYFLVVVPEVVLTFDPVDKILLYNCYSSILSLVQFLFQNRRVKLNYNVTIQKGLNMLFLFNV